MPSTIRAISACGSPSRYTNLIAMPGILVVASSSDDALDLAVDRERLVATRHEQLEQEFGADRERSARLDERAAARDVLGVVGEERVEPLVFDLELDRTAARRCVARGRRRRPRLTIPGSPDERRSARRDPADAESLAAADLDRRWRSALGVGLGWLPLFGVLGFELAIVGGAVRRGAWGSISAQRSRASCQRDAGRAGSSARRIAGRDVARSTLAAAALAVAVRADPGGDRARSAASGRRPATGGSASRRYARDAARRPRRSPARSATRSACVVRAAARSSARLVAQLPVAACRRARGAVAVLQRAAGVHLQRDPRLLPGQPVRREHPARRAARVVAARAARVGGRDGRAGRVPARRAALPHRLARAAPGGPAARRARGRGRPRRRRDRAARSQAARSATRSTPSDIADELDGRIETAHFIIHYAHTPEIDARHRADRRGSRVPLRAGRRAARRRARRASCARSTSPTAIRRRAGSARATSRWPSRGGARSTSTTARSRTRRCATRSRTRSRARSAIRSFGVATRASACSLQPGADRGARGRDRLAGRLRPADAARGGARDAGAWASSRRSAQLLSLRVLLGVVGARLHDGRLVPAVPARPLRRGEAARAVPQRRRLRGARTASRSRRSRPSGAR